MRITIVNDTLRVDGWLRKKKFEAKAGEITEVRVMADSAIPDSRWDRMKLELGRIEPVMKLRAVMLIAGDDGITLDNYHDKEFDAAVAWLKGHGWNLDAAAEKAIETPLIRVPVSKRRTGS